MKKEEKNRKIKAAERPIVNVSSVMQRSKSRRINIITLKMQVVPTSVDGRACDGTHRQSICI